MNMSEEQTLEELEPFALPDPEAKLWRYMDLAQFVDLARNRCLHMGSVAGLDDANEGTLHPFIQQKLPSDAPASEPWGWAVSCWHLSDYENYGMWKQYGNKRGVAIQSTCGILQNSLHIPHVPYTFIARVSYWDYRSNTVWPDDCSPPGKWIQNERLPFLCKRREFAHEQEGRILHDMREILERWRQTAGKKKNNMKKIDHIRSSLPVSPERLVERVFLHPRAELWVRNVIKGLIKDYLDCMPVSHNPDPLPKGITLD